jgi:hypothetical protein
MAEAYWRAAAEYTLWVQGPPFAEQRLALATELFAGDTEGVSLATQQAANLRFWHVFLEAGDRAGAEGAARRSQELARRTRQPNFQLSSMGMDARIAVLDGRLEEALEIGQRMLDYGKQADLGQVARAMVNAAMALAAFYTGRMDAISGAWTTAIAAGLEGRFEDAIRLMEPALSRLSQDPEPENVWMMELATVAEAAALARDARAASVILRLAGGATTAFIPHLWTVSVARILASMSVLCGEVRAARGYWERAIHETASLPHRPEHALAVQGLSELLIERYPDERATAMEHLDFAIREFREMKMQPSLERALRHRGLLKA